MPRPSQAERDTPRAAVENASAGANAVPWLWHVLPLCVLMLALLLWVGGLRIGLGGRIEENAQRARLAEINAVLPESFQDDIFAHRFTLDGHALLGGGQAEAFPIMQDGAQTGIVLAPVTVRGYKGEIALLVGIRRDGALLGVRVLRHQETPGIGDGIEARRSDWILGFSGLGLAGQSGATAGGGAGQLWDRPGRAIQEEQWALRPEGGYFDQLSGATITSRAVVEATKKTLQYHHAQHGRLYRDMRQ